jgi:hypothetical protein
MSCTCTPSFNPHPWLYTYVLASVMYTYIIISRWREVGCFFGRKAPGTDARLKAHSTITSTQHTRPLPHCTPAGPSGALLLPPRGLWAVPQQAGAAVHASEGGKPI